MFPLLRQLRYFQLAENLRFSYIVLLWQINTTFMMAVVLNQSGVLSICTLKKQFVAKENYEVKLVEFQEFGTGFNDYFNFDHRGIIDGESGSEKDDLISGKNYQFLTGVPEDAPALTEKFQ